MRTTSFRMALALALVAGSALLTAQTPDFYSAMHWREIGPTRAGRARALAGVPGQPNVFYIGFDNGGVWRSTDYGVDWMPLFDDQSTGSIGAIAVAPSNPNIIYVGTGAGIIRPDLAHGRRHVQVHRRRQDVDAPRAARQPDDRDVDVDPTNPDRLFVAALGHPYGPNAERGVFRSTDGGKTFEKVLYKDEYTSANDVRIDPRTRNTCTRRCGSSSRASSRAPGSAAPAMASSSPPTAARRGSSWRAGLPSVLQANLAIAPAIRTSSTPSVAGATPQAAGRARRDGGTTGVVGFYKSTDGGEHWFLATSAGPTARRRCLAQDPRPLVRIGGGDLPTIAVDPEERERRLQRVDRVVAHEDGGLTWSGGARRAGRRRLPEDLDQPEQSRHHPRRRRPGRRGVGESRRVVEQLVQPADRGDVSRVHRQRVSVSRVRRPAGLRLARAWRAARTMARSPSTTGIR